jgi:hypothetical protein
MGLSRRNPLLRGCTLRPARGVVRVRERCFLFRCECLLVLTAPARR